MLRNWYNRNFIIIEFLEGVAITLLFVLWVENIAGRETMFNWLFGIRKELYATIASVSGALLGFIITSVSIVIVFTQSERLELLRKSKHYPTLYRVFTVAIKYLGFTALMALMCLLVDKDSHPQSWAVYLVVLGSVLSIVGIARCVWVLENMISVATKKENS
jgi:hypothetical protein